MKLRAGDVAVITGAASGIGYALAANLLDRGVHVMLADLRPDALEDARRSLTGPHGHVAALRTDVTDADAVNGLAAAALQRFGRVDLVCNNAGAMAGQAPAWEHDPATWRWMIDVKLMGVVHGVRAFAPLLLTQGSGHVLNTASLSGLAPVPSLSPYSAVMHAVVGLTETLNLELRSVCDRVGATVLCPGLVDTALGTNSAATAPAGASAIAGDPADSGFGTPITAEQVAAAALDAVTAGRVHAVVGPDAPAMTRGRVDALLADLS